MGGPALTIPSVPLPAWLQAINDRSAQYVGAKETFEIPADIRQDFNEVLAAREQAREKRDDLWLDSVQHRLDRHEQRELSTASYEVNEASRWLGEMGGEVFIDERFPGAEKVYPPDGAPSRSGDFDQVWKAEKDGKTVWVVVEAKGGSSGLAGRTLADGSFAQQGSSAYFDRIVELMGRTPEGRGVAQELESARVWDAVQYFEVRAPLGESHGQAVLKPIEATEFKLSK